MDVIVIGAGAAGLAAARELARARWSVLVLEARDRIGGRCWSRFEPEVGTPIEYGAEFIHGRPRATFRWLRRFALTAVERKGTAWIARAGGLKPRDRAGFIAQVCAAMERSGSPRSDLAFETYLEHKLVRHLSADTVLLLRRMVEGYHAAELERVSARAIVDEWTRAGAGVGITYRPSGGYGTLLGALAAEALSAGVHVRLQSVVRSLQWRRGRVTVEGSVRGQAFREQAPRVLLTLPIGVLKQPPGGPGAVRFSPALEPKRAALAALSSGAALKVVLRFRRAFWETLERGRFRDAGFFQSPEAMFPTFWTAFPARAPLLVAWAGGPRALRFLDADPATITEQALASAQSVFGAAVDVTAELSAGYVHDWLHDPYARGAYSYVNVGGMTARKALAAPLEQTLYFAGEATDADGEAATVAGALASGQRAARELLADASCPPALRRGRRLVSKA